MDQMESNHQPVVPKPALPGLQTPEAPAPRESPGCEQQWRGSGRRLTHRGPSLWREIFRL